MTKDERSQPIAGEDTKDISSSAAADDTEGQSMGLLMGVNVLGQAGGADTRSRTKKPTEEELPPLSKKWPSMRDDKKG